ncbi:MAG: integrase [Rubrivivax sp.]|nr:MAG: integrase [Rubrivivax sp.]
MTLAEARAKRDELRKKVLDGVDPRVVATKAKQMSLREAGDAYWAGRNDVSAGYAEMAQRAFERHLYPALGAMPIRSVTRELLMAELKKMDDAKLYDYVRKVRMWIGQVFDWAIERGECDVNPAAAIRPEKAFGKKQVESFAAVRVVDVPVLMKRLALEGELSSVLACRMLALTWVRTVELRFMRWDELEPGLWRIPKGKMKRRLEHLVPLTRQAVKLLEELKLRARGSPYVFPGERDLQRPISENTVLYLLHRIGYKGLMTGHGWRSVVSTWANERGYNPDAIERQLAHTPDDKVRAAYNRAAYLPERRAMLQAWADWLDKPDAGLGQGAGLPGHGFAGQGHVGLGQDAAFQPAANGLAADVQAPLEIRPGDQDVLRGNLAGRV